MVAHNFVPFIGITISLLFGAGTAFEWSIITGFAAGFGIFGLAMNKNHKKKKMVVKPVVSVAMPNPIDPNDDDEKKKERQFNEMSKTEFFKKVKEDYRYDKQMNVYVKIKGKKGLKCSKTGKDIEFLVHLDVETYGSNKVHLGSIRTSDYVMYKGPKPKRKL